MDTHRRSNKTEQPAAQASLRMFLMIHSCRGKWQHVVCSNLKHALRVWRSRKGTAQDTGVLHVGFNPLPFQQFDHLANLYSGRMLLTVTAKYSLPKYFTVSDKPIASMGNFSVYLGLRGWGYTTKNRMKANNTTTKPQDWLSRYIEINPSTEKILNIYEIYDDASYLKSEHQLESHIRLQIGMFRYSYLIGANCKDPCEIARAVPPWMAERELKSLNVSNKIHNLFTRKRLRTIADLATWTSESLLKEPLFGYKTLYSIATRLHTLFNDDTMYNVKQSSLVDLDNHTAVVTDPHTKVNYSLVENIKKFMHTISDDDRYLFKNRSGFEISPRSLAQIAHSHGTKTRNLRRIEIEIINKIKQNLFWDLFVQKITQLLKAQNNPLSIMHLETIDSWFKGVSKQLALLEYLLRIANKDKLHIIKIDDIHYICTIDQSTWKSTIPKAKALLRAASNKEWSETEACMQVQKLLPDSAQVFSNMLWNQASLLCHFRIESDATRILVGYGKVVHARQKANTG